MRAILTNYVDVEKNDRFDISRSSKFLYLGAALPGLIWGNSWVLLSENTTLIELSAVGLWLASMLAGAATTMAIISSVFLSFVVPTALSFIIYNVLKTS